MRHNALPGGVTREQLLAWFRQGRKRTAELFDLVAPDAYYDRPIALRNPIVFYEGHLPAFSVNTLVKLAHKHRGVDARLEKLFERGIDPEDELSARTPTDLWPSREEVQAFGRACDELVECALSEAPLEDDDVPELRGGEAVFTILEHELMHQETLLYMFHQLPFEKKKVSSRAQSRDPLHTRGGSLDFARDDTILIPRGLATLGQVQGFGWDNEFPHHTVDVPEFTIDAHNVTNGDYLEFVEATGAKPPHFWVRGEHEWYWRGMFALHPLQMDAPVYVTHDEAVAYAAWKGKRLPTEAEFHRAAFGTPSGEERLHPWGDDEADSTRGNFDFASLDPVPAGSYAPSAWGVHDLVGNGWEWTSTHFDGFAGFEPMASYKLYSADFFDRAHFVLKGASPVTAKELVRRSFRNWFRPNYPYVYATFRLVS